MEDLANRLDGSFAKDKKVITDSAELRSCGRDNSRHADLISQNVWDYSGGLKYGLNKGFAPAFEHVYDAIQELAKKHCFRIGESANGNFPVLVEIL